MSLKYTCITGFLLLVGAALWWHYHNRYIEPPSALSRNINYTFAISNQSSNAIPKLKISLYSPISESPYQKLTRVEASIPFTSTDNSQLAFTEILLPPLAIKVISVQATVAMWDTPRRTPPPNDTALLPSPYIESDAAEITSIAKSLARPDKLNLAQALFSWITQNIEPEIYNSAPISALTTMKQRKGDCTDSAHLFIALARASGIPARLVSGFYVDRDKRLRATDFHNWAEFYHNREWKIADPNLGNFNTNYTNYIAFQYPAGTNEAEYLKNSARVTTNSPHVKVAFD